MKRLNAIERAVEIRDRLAPQIIDRRVEELLDPNLKWDESASNRDRGGSN